jgi:hypothetical protein
VLFYRCSGQAVSSAWVAMTQQEALGHLPDGRAANQDDAAEPESGFAQGDSLVAGASRQQPSRALLQTLPGYPGQDPAGGTPSGPSEPEGGPQPLFLPPPAPARIATSSPGLQACFKCTIFIKACGERFIWVV